MEIKSVNFSAFNFSPHFWWETIETGVGATDVIGMELMDNFSFRNWLKEGAIEHHSLEIYNEDKYGSITDDEFARMVSNNYFDKVIAINKFGNKVSANSLERLYSYFGVGTEAELSYSFKIDSIHHFAMLHFFKWLTLNSHFEWVRWQLFYDFIISKLDNPLRGMYQYFWSIIFTRVNSRANFFTEVIQYKTFRDKLDEIIEESNFVEKEYITIRQSKEKD